MRLQNEAFLLVNRRFVKVILNAEKTQYHPVMTNLCRSWLFRLFCTNAENTNNTKKENKHLKQYNKS